MDKVIGVFKSRTPNGPGHVIRERNNGQLYCDCKAAQHDRECWALTVVIGNLEFDKLRKKVMEADNITIPDKQKLIDECNAYCTERNFRFAWLDDINKVLVPL